MTTTWHAKEAIRELYAHVDEDTARRWIERLIDDMADRDNPVEVRSLARTDVATLTEGPGPRLALLSLHERTRRGSQHSRQAGQVAAQLPGPLTALRALRRQARVAPARHHHTPMRSEEPL